MVPPCRDDPLVYGIRYYYYIFVDSRPILEREDPMIADLYAVLMACAAIVATCMGALFSYRSFKENAEDRVRLLLMTVVALVILYWSIDPALNVLHRWIGTG